MLRLRSPICGSSFVRNVASITAPPTTMTLPGRDSGIFRDEFFGGVWHDHALGAERILLTPCELPRKLAEDIALDRPA